MPPHCVDQKLSAEIAWITAIANQRQGYATEVEEEEIVARKVLINVQGHSY